MRGGAAAAAPAPRDDWAAIAVARVLGRRRAAVAGRTARDATWPRCRRCAGRDGRCGRHAHHHHRFDAPPARPGRRDGSLARLPVPLHVLREGQLPQRLPQAAAGDHPRRARRPDRAGRRRTSTSSTRSSCRTASCCEALVDAAGRSSACRRGSTSGRRDARSARRGGMRLDRGGRREHQPKRAATCSTRTCRLTTERARPSGWSTPRERVPFVQANLIDAQIDDRGRGRARGASICSSTACGPTSRCRCSPIPARPTTRSAGARPTTRPGSARMRALPRASRSLQRHPGRATAAAEDLELAPAGPPRADAPAGRRRCRAS